MESLQETTYALATKVYEEANKASQNTADATNNSDDTVKEAQFEEK